MPLKQKIVVANRIKTARNEKRISIRDMAKKLGVSPQTYVDIEDGKTSPRLEMLEQIAIHTKKTTEFFIKGKYKK